MANFDVGEPDRKWRGVPGSGDGIAMRTCCRTTEYARDGVFDFSRHDMFPFACFAMCLGPRQAEHVSQKAFSESVTPNDETNSLSRPPAAIAPTNWAIQ